MNVSGLCARLRGTRSGMHTLGAAVRLDRRLIQVHGGSFTRNVTADARIMSTRAVLTAIHITHLTTCCRCSITLVGLLTVYKAPRQFRGCFRAACWGLPFVGVGGGDVDVTFIVVLTTAIVVSLTNVLLVDQRPLILRKRIRTARVHVDKGLPKHISSFLMRRNS